MGIYIALQSSGWTDPRWHWESIKYRTKKELDTAFDLVNKRVREVATLNSITTAKLATSIYGYMGGEDEVNWLPTEDKQLHVSDSLLLEILNMDFMGTGDFKHIMFTMFRDRLKTLDEVESE